MGNEVNIRDDKLKILIMLQYYVPHRTGLTIHVQRVAEALAQRGHQVTVLTARYSKALPRDETINGVRVVRLWAPIRVSRGMVMPAYPLAAWRLIRSHDVISIHTPMLETALVAFLARLAGKKIVATHHGDLILPSGAFNRFIEWFVFQLYKYMARNAARLIAYSHDYADHSYYLLPFRDKVSVVYPPIQMPLPNPDHVRELRAQWSMDGGPIIGYAGRFVEEKRPDLLIRSLEVVLEEFPNARIVFAGEYQIKYEDFWERNQHLVEQYRDHLIFLGLLTDNQQMADFYAACDVLVLPSDTECFALVQVESMLCGTPVIATDTPGAREVVKVTGMGRLAQVGNWRSIGEMIVEVIGNRARYVKSRQEIENRFSFEETVNRYERHFRNAAKAARKR